ncbi:hypothetical protein SPRG_14098 [Saprolegnia parasitica CBS 223.65]|uniref:phosphomevalonate kinase n=1 Tax=Saprolegnia parasitica (strain CBS 223.65) TaxID=695850 RepID=A0A067C233_SAPPC|nr:hypothetical protein SPRG_14098 [Saprolegnia parasitica CBS 223.65]KDO20867.1 hypothetical protein SPRG_14098 [Saprolegnia parasitica CBS 223.65]|eukprot:XP_012208445.1 hypothetical protein SPRG_14098 [Saprolegnia parasitica CBS 223.65]
MTTTTMTRVSAPGKVLIAGGYLVLEPQYAGAVLAASSRFHTAVSLDASATPSSALAVTVHSPQFHQVLTGVLSADAFELSPQSPANPYVEKTLQVCAKALHGLLGPAFGAKLASLAKTHSLRITLEADNDFYSQSAQLLERGLPVTREHLAKLPAFLPCPLDASGTPVIAKTGMGSSAALITSLVGAVLRFFGAVTLPTAQSTAVTPGVDIVHHLAQIAHSIAQDKIGSGFDVSAAAYGNQCYNRFSPERVQSFVAQKNLSAIAPADLAACIQSRWDNVVKPFGLPHNMHMIMGDVNAGSATVSMVRQVLAWKKADAAGSHALWETLNAKNMQIVAQFEALPAVADDVWARLAEAPSTSWVHLNAVLGAALLAMRATFEEIRHLLRTMGSAAGVAIEPEEQTALIDATMRVPGVLFGGVPGAGGNDAIFALVLHPSVLPRVETFWSTWTATRVSALLVDVAKSGVQGGLLEEAVAI